MISMVAAMGNGNVIGNKGHLPWGHDMASDIKRYSDLIKDHTIVMGADTFNEADHARSRSKVAVLSREELDLPEGVKNVHSVEEILKLGKPEEEVFVTGGGGVFHLMIDHADRLYLTRIHNDFEGDVLFPEVDEAVWKISNSEDYKKDDNNKYDYSFITYDRKQ